MDDYKSYSYMTPVVVGMHRRYIDWAFVLALGGGSVSVNVVGNPHKSITK